MREPAGWKLLFKVEACRLSLNQLTELLHRDKSFISRNIAIRWVFEEQK